MRLPPIAALALSAGLLLSACQTQDTGGAPGADADGFNGIAKGDTIHIGAINDRAKDLVEKIINDQVAKNLDQVIAEIYDRVKGPMSPAAFEKELRDKLISPARAKAIGLMAAQEIKKKKLTPA